MLKLIMVTLFFVFFLLMRFYFFSMIKCNDKGGEIMRNREKLYQKKLQNDYTK